MGCGSSRLPVRVGVFPEDDDDFYPDPSLVDSWVRESVCDSPSYCIASPPPYTPLPLSGHVTLMLSSPAKRQNSVHSALDGSLNTDLNITGGTCSSQLDETSPTQSNSVLETTLYAERRRSVVSDHQDEIVPQREALSASPARQDFSSSHSSAEMRALQQTAEQMRTPGIVPATETEVGLPALSGSPTGAASTAAIDIPGTRSTCVDAENTRIPQSLSPNILGRVKLSSSFPSARPPSPFPRTRSLSTCLPPLTRVQPSGTDQRPTTSALVYELCEQHTPFRLPPLALQRQTQAAVNSDHSDSEGGRHRHKKRLRVRSRSCQIEHSGLSSVQEHTVPIIS